MNKGAYRPWPANDNGDAIDLPSTESDPRAPNPMDEAATSIYFIVRSDAPQPLPKDQFDLQLDIQRALSVVQKLYLPPQDAQAGVASPKFRGYYNRLFRLAQLGLDGPMAMPDVARAALNSVEADLIDEEGAVVKNGHLQRLGLHVLGYSAPFFLLYWLIRICPECPLVTGLASLGAVPVVFANFMLLWIGCFVGVWLSYAVRTQALVLNDLVVTDADRLRPHLRLIFAGTLTMTLGIAFLLQIIEIKIGNISMTGIGSADGGSLAFLVGILCGVAHLLLGGVIARRAENFVSSIK